MKGIVNFVSFFCLRFIFLRPIILGFTSTFFVMASPTHLKIVLCTNREYQLDIYNGLLFKNKKQKIAIQLFSVFFAFVLVFNLFLFR